MRTETLFASLLLIFVLMAGCASAGVQDSESERGQCPAYDKTIMYRSVPKPAKGWRAAIGYLASDAADLLDQINAVLERFLDSSRDTLQRDVYRIQGRPANANQGLPPRVDPGATRFRR